MNSYLDKIEMAVRYICDHLDKPFNWKEVAMECGISEYHFHRIFSAQMNESPGNYIKRKRMEAAVAFLAYGCGEPSISDIALAVGYSSQANLTKAFKDYFGVTPGEVLKGEEGKNSKIGKIKSKYGKDFRIKDLYPDINLDSTRKEHFKEIYMKAEIKEIPVRRVVYRKSEGGYEKSSIHNTWKGLIEDSMSLMQMKYEDMVTLGIGHDNPQVTPEDKCLYEACIVIDENTKPGDKFQTKDLPAGKYACFRYQGKSEGVLQFYLDIYKNWFPNSKYEPGDFPLIENYFEVDMENDTVDMETQFLVK